MTNEAKRIYPDTIRFSRVLPGSPVRIWEYFTVPSLISEWLADARIDLRPGGQVELTFNTKELTARAQGGAIISGTVTRCAPPRVLSYSWQDSAVTFELKTESGEVELVLTHSGLGEPLIPKICTGWHAHLEMLEALLRGEEPKSLQLLFHQCSEQYQVLQNSINEDRRSNLKKGESRDRRRAPRGGDFV